MGIEYLQNLRKLQEIAMQPELCDECKTRGIPGTQKFNWPLCDDCIKRNYAPKEASNAE